MNFETVLIQLLSNERLKNPIENQGQIDAKAGYYAIWVRNRNKLGEEFSEELKARKTLLLYIGKADKSLRYRLINRELQLKGAATFFRTLGAVLGFLPAQGSLKGNSANFKFEGEDHAKITKWIAENIEVSIAYQTPSKEFENALIANQTPIFNWQNNPRKFQPVHRLRAKCIAKARTPK